MPQGHRKTPYSGKQKKAQLSAKKQSKSMKTHVVLKRTNSHRSNESDDEPETFQNQLERIQKLNVNSKDSRSKSVRYALQFHRETEKELQEMKEDARRKIQSLHGNGLELNENVFSSYDFPRRPGWDYKMSRGELERIENRYFNDYIFKFKENNLSYFELNLETWRQLWRVLELSDIILIIVDIRYPNLMFPPSVYEYVTKELDKSMILVLNKIDLAPARLVVAWKKYFEETYPDLQIVMFTSFPSYNLRGGKIANQQRLKIRRQRGKPKMAAEGAMQILKACKEIVSKDIDLSDWEEKINEELRDEHSNENVEEGAVKSERVHDEDQLEFDFKDHVKYNNGILTVGCIGFPNVGKSSLLNALMGRKVVSVSRTPGHTKHFQTIFLTNNVRLCDCPGLVFPSSTPRKLQVLMGSYPIAQLREPYASIKFLAERINLPKLLNIKLDEEYADCDDLNSWSAIEICESWAIKRGFLTAKAGRPDSYRAANHILRMALDGKLSLCLCPPGFNENIDKWSNHPEIQIVETIQALGKEDENEVNTKTEEDESESGSDVKQDSSDDDEEDDDNAIATSKNTFALLAEE